jgi:hypothetical protein
VFEKGPAITSAISDAGFAGIALIVMALMSGMYTELPAKGLGSKRALNEQILQNGSLHSQLVAAEAEVSRIRASRIAEASPGIHFDRRCGSPFALDKKLVTTAEVQQAFEDLKAMNYDRI